MQTIDDLKEYLISQDKKSKLEALDKIAKYCRYLQKEHMERDGKISGTCALSEMVSSGALTQEMFFRLHPAVINYNAPYEIILKDEVENTQKGLE